MPDCDPDDAVGEIDVEDLVHLGDAEHDGVFLRDGAAAQGGAGAARHDLDAVLVAEAQDRRRPPRSTRQHDGERHLAIGGQAVGLEGAALVLGDDQRLRRDEPRQARDDLRPARQDSLSGAEMRWSWHVLRGDALTVQVPCPSLSDR